MIRQLIDKKVAFITGKGGTGKTTLCAALGIVASRQGKRVLLAEVDMTRPSIEDIFGKPIGFKPVQLADGIDGANVRFIDALHAYLLETISVDVLVGRILKNKVVRYFLESTPFAREISFLNTFFHFYEQAIQGGRYDLIIIDLPSTGHAFPILNVPQHVFKMFRIGPLLKRARQMNEFLADHHRVIMSIITLPEEMPINETIEVFDKIRAELPIALGPLFVNRLGVEEFVDEEARVIERALSQLPSDAPDRLRQVLSAGEEGYVLSSRARSVVSRLRDRVDLPIVYIRELEEPKIEPPAYRMARVLEQGL